ncbi:pectate lyase family protein [Streptomyces sp. WI04-05B]|uniref:pectate lyase family protein n=1 Tax=Streptomyces TaxID=1883 RepID=UPI0029A57BEA|nr:MULTISPECIES: pectate lyase [unclassified Streptomyces]MDX2541108.1 pectate lyase [Streptomyces sp. WI04-05B]MDX2585662.1 pectate lyase [Streptomyces sp. WI04-05A]MDX3752172.1 pectate lyase [Streptomyces sp. AK08-02]
MNVRACHDHVTMKAAVLLGCTALVLTVTGPAAQAAPAPDLGRQTLAAGDGWGSDTGGTTGGSAADADHVYTVTTWAQFKAALADGGSAPKIIRVKGMIDAVSEGCEAFTTGGYDLQQYLKDYDPAVWGNDKVASGPQEDARVASAANQDSVIKAAIPSNTTIVGVGKNSGILGGSLQIKAVSNVILRNLTIEAPLDCFPKWDPTDDNNTGNWNSEYDAVVVYGTDHVWIDHNTLTDGRYPDSERPSYFGKVFQQHDGLTDIVRGANYVTVSWNSFKDHDKNMLIGNSDSTASTDGGKLKVTMHHNKFDGILQRSPRVRFGQVDVYNNSYVVGEAQKADYYLFGVGISSQLYASDNAISLPAGASVGKVLKKWKESPLTAVNNYVNGRLTDLIAVHNAEIPEETLQSGAGWTPTLRTKVDSPRAVPSVVNRGAGAGKVC